MRKSSERIIVCEKDENRIKFANEHYPDVLTVMPEECLDFVRQNSDYGGADVVLEVAGADMYGKNLTSRQAALTAATARKS